MRRAPGGEEYVMNDPEYIALIGTNSVRNSQGIYTVHLERGTLKASVVSTQSAYNTGALALSADGRRLYAASETRMVSPMPSSSIPPMPMPLFSRPIW